MALLSAMKTPGCFLILLLPSVLAAAHVDYSDNYELQEYCQLETFSPRCRHDDVIVMTAARFGRMRIGKCIDGDGDGSSVLKKAVQTDPSGIGCYSDVLDYADRVCSGKPDCDISIPNRDLLSTRPCFAQLTMHFEASYKCVAVVEEDRSCTVATTAGQRLHVLSSSGSVTRRDWRCGSRSSPWVLEAQTGQQINISLLDFAGRDKETVSSDLRRHSSGSVSDDCLVQYGYMVDKTGKKNISICRTSRMEREKFIYQSTGNVMEIVLRAPSENGSTLLLSFEAVGCSNLVPPADAWLRRTGNEATVGCYTTRQRWQLRCDGSQWKGALGTCTADLTAPKSAEVLHMPEEQESSFFQLLVIVAVSFAGLAVCLIIVFVGIGCARRYQKNGSIDSVNLLIGPNGNSGCEVKCHTTNNRTNVPGQSSIYRNQSRADTMYRDVTPQYFVLDRDALTNGNSVSS